MTDRDRIYHERQVKELCALHALNNLFQTGDAFTKTELDLICHSLSPDNWINPHKSVLGLGNYDVNVIMKALLARNFEMIWFDRRKDPACLNLDIVWGYILNVPSDYKFGFITLPLKKRHWITVRKIDDFYYNLDSKLDSPHVIGGDRELLDFLRDELEHKDKQLFLVVADNVAETQGWLRDREGYDGPATIEGNNDSNRDAEVVQLKDLERDRARLNEIKYVS